MLLQVVGPWLCNAGDIPPLPCVQVVNQIFGSQQPWVLPKGLLACSDSARLPAHPAEATLPIVVRGAAERFLHLQKPELC